MSFDSLDVRKEATDCGADVDDGLALAVGCLRGHSVAICALWERKGIDTLYAYRALIDWSTPRVMCDITSSYARSVGILAQAERVFASARYV